MQGQRPPVAARFREGARVGHRFAHCGEAFEETGRQADAVAGQVVVLTGEVDRGGSGWSRCLRVSWVGTVGGLGFGVAQRPVGGDLTIDVGVVPPQFAREERGDVGC